MILGRQNSNPLMNMGKIFSPQARGQLGASTGNQMGGMTSQLPLQQTLNEQVPLSSVPATVRRGAPMSQGNGPLQGMDGGRTDFSGLMSQYLAGADARMNGKQNPYSRIQGYQKNQALASLLADRNKTQAGE
jgi:hypothetical protein